jgi:CIC family chloride channel protein
MTRFSTADSQYQLQSKGSLVVLVLLALVVGVVSGLVGAAFRITLERADRLRDGLITWAHGESFAGFLFIIGSSAAAALIAALLVRRFSPHASGSGIPHVEAVLDGQIPPAPYGLVPVKFVGGVLAIGSGLALGREGPSVQMGASIAHFVGQVFRRDWPDCRVLIAAGAGAGLATAFNAPIAGALFVLEELVQKFEHRIAIAALAASATAIAVARTLLPDAPDFVVAPLSYGAPEARPLFFVLGGISGLLAVAYNNSLLATIAAAERLKRLPVEARAGLIGAAVGALGWFAPTLIGGGDAITQRTLANIEVLTFLPIAFLVRFLLGAISYAASTPGGLFAPLLTLGAQSGLLFGAAYHFAFPAVDIQPEAFAVVGMAAFFTGVVRAPLTGIVLVTEMTASVTMLLPMLGACCVAMLVPTLMRNPPIYDSLREHTLRSERARQREIGKKQTLRAED